MSYLHNSFLGNVVAQVGLTSRHPSLIEKGEAKCKCTQGQKPQTCQQSKLECCGEVCTILDSTDWITTGGASSHEWQVTFILMVNANP